MASSPFKIRAENKGYNRERVCSCCGTCPFIFCRKAERFQDMEAKRRKKERDFQSEVICAVRNRFPGAIVIKNDPNYIQGFPDLTIFYRDKWAVLECKRSANETHQPNQDYYVDTLNAMSYSAFIFPENKEEVLREIQQAFKSGRKARVSRSKQV